MKSITALFLAATLAFIAPLSVADVLLLEAINEAPANNNEGLPRPRTGQTMDTVRSRFGAPAQEIPWVGEPPISRWIYDDFTVYFEHEHVINTVVHR